MFNRKSKNIKSLQKKLDVVNMNSRNAQKESIEDMILVLDNLREINNEKLQWKHRQLVINNTIDLTKEKLVKKLVELNIDPQF